MSATRVIDLPITAEGLSSAPSRQPARRLAAPLAAVAVFGAGASLLLAASSASAAQGPVGLGRADGFAILAGAGITNTGSTTVTGDIGTHPTPSQTGFGSITLSGANHADDAVTQGAKDDLVTAYDDAFGRSPAADVPVELGGSTLLAGVYTSPSLGLTGTLTLDAEGSTDAMFIFQAGSTLITEVNSRVLLINGASPCNVVWQVGSSATFKTGTEMVGDVLAQASITAQTSATFQGRLLARDGAVTLDTNTITKGACAPREVTTATTSAPTTESGATTPTTSGTTPTTSGTTPTTSGTTTPSTSGTAPATPVDSSTGSGFPPLVVPTPRPPLDVTTALNAPPGLTGTPQNPTPEGTPASTPSGELTNTPRVALGSGPGTPVRTAGSPPPVTSLPVTGISAVHLQLAGLMLLVLGLAANATGRRARRR